MSRQWSLIGAPSSAGAHTPGVEKAPAALRAAGLAEALGGVTDLGDVPGFRWRPDPSRRSAQNAPVVARVARDVAAAVAAAPAVPIVLGGDCTVTLGLVAGSGSPALVYVDGGPDLYTPETRPHGNLDAMGLAHLLALPGAAPELAGAAPGATLSILAAGPQFAGLTVTEVNPDHLPEPSDLRPLVTMLAAALS